jgi:peptidoglycan L-alanyl-D-glutamate endopeptidase CwlK
MASRDIKDCDPQLQALFAMFDLGMKKAGIDYIVTCTYRSNDEQNKLYAQGRTVGGSVVTNCRGGESLHNVCTADKRPLSRAFDIVVMDSGKPDWDATNPAWKRAGNIGKSIGLEWAGDWKSFREYPHFQLLQNRKV